MCLRYWRILAQPFHFLFNPFLFNNFYIFPHTIFHEHLNQLGSSVVPPTPTDFKLIAMQYSRAFVTRKRDGTVSKQSLYPIELCSRGIRHFVASQWCWGSWGPFKCYVMQWEGVSFPGKSVTKVYISTLLALREGGWGSNIQEKSVT